ncbi:MAG TPA: hypothetical protein VF803_03110 [Candidatus Paceibacterota bacterium]
MSFGTILGLVFYIAQNFGIALGVGGATMSLILASRNRAHNIEASDIAGRIERLGLWFIVVSGIFITLAHLIASEIDVLTAPVYTFKWVLIALIFVFNVVASITRIKDEPHAPIVGITVATWYALFVVHTAQPAFSYAQFFGIYASWVVVSFVLFNSYTTRKEVSAPAVSASPSTTSTQ